MRQNRETTDASRNKALTGILSAERAGGCKPGDVICLVSEFIEAVHVVRSSPAFSVRSFETSSDILPASFSKEEVGLTISPEPSALSESRSTTLQSSAAPFQA